MPHPSRSARQAARVAAGLLPVVLTAFLAPSAAATARGAAAGTDPAAARPGEALVIQSVSNPRPDLVSGEQVLLRVVPPVGVDPASVRVTRNGGNVTGVFTTGSDGTLLGLVTGLQVGSNTVQATTVPRRARTTATLTVVDHPGSGPVFSGAWQTPYVCRTTESGLAPSQGPACDAPPVVTYRYKTVNGGFQPLANPYRTPRDVTTATVNGQSVPYIVRIEQGVVNRAVYQFATLFDRHNPDPTRPSAYWNGRLVYTFGGGCNAGYNQGFISGSGTGPDNDLFLGQGYAVATSTLNILNYTCSTILSAETAMMVKERFVETFGPVTHTIGWGGSGGSIQQYFLADAYPGILDGIVPVLAFPNTVGNNMAIAADCRLLSRYDASPDGTDPTVDLTPEQLTAVSGFHSFGACTTYDIGLASRIQAVASCNQIVPVDARWDPVTHPDGVTCSADAAYVKQFGVDPAGGLTNSPLDNVGVQYGVQALRAGIISPAQFAALNAGIGGFDFRGEQVPERSTADLPAVQAVYADDLLMTGGLGIATTPIVELRPYVEVDGVSAHTSEWSYVTRQRLVDAGTVGNSVLLETAAETTAQDDYVLHAVDSWLDAIAADTSRRTAQKKVEANRPAWLGDGCFLTDGTDITTETLTYHGDGPCAQAFPVGSNPRLAAGETLAMTTVKCALKPLTRSAYLGITFTDAEWAQLQRAFPTGICDYDQPGVGAVAPLGTWLDYGDGSG